MIHFVTSRQSYDQLVASSAWPPDSLWVALGVLSPAELTRLRANGLAVTDFTTSISSHNLAEALETIREHHPGETVWVDGAAEA